MPVATYENTHYPHSIAQTTGIYAKPLLHGDNKLIDFWHAADTTPSLLHGLIPEL